MAGRHRGTAPTENHACGFLNLRVKNRGDAGHAIVDCILQGSADAESPGRLDQILKGPKPGVIFSTSSSSVSDTGSFATESYIVATVEVGPLSVRP